jgi:hypothetical protein
MCAKLIKIKGFTIRGYAAGLRDVGRRRPRVHAHRFLIRARRR